MELLLVLGVPFAGGIVLAFWGHRAFAPELNSGMSLLTLLAAVDAEYALSSWGPPMLFCGLVVAFAARLESACVKRAA